MIRIGIIAPYEEFYQQIQTLFPHEIECGGIYVESLSPSLDEFSVQAKRLESMGLDAIIARGGTYEIIRPAVSIPVVQIPIALIDVMDALVRAQTYSKKIIVVLRSTNCISLESVRDAIGYDFELVRYERDEMETDLGLYSENNVVIVGGLFACNMAREHGLDSCPIRTTSDTILQTVAATMEMLEKTKMDVERGRLHAAILENIHDAVLNINPEGVITAFNRQAEQLLHIDRNVAIGGNLRDIAPELALVQDAFSRGEGFAEQLVALGQHIVSANLHILRGTRVPDSGLCTFQDVSDLVNLENRIRRELNKKGMTAKVSFSDIVCEDPLTKQTVSDAEAIALADAAVLIVGESGVGKEMFAQSIHNKSRRKHGPFVAVNCCALSESLLESELFGYVDGAFTGAKKGGKTGLFELAHGGTFFLDEINSISPAMQAKLLRVLQEKEIMRIGSDYVTPLDIRVIAASNETIYDKLSSGEFRSDLYYRLGIFELHIPPLRRRRGDILPLFNTFCARLAAENGTKPAPLSEEDKQALKNYQWVGNIREVRSVAERYALGLARQDGVRSLFSTFGRNGPGAERPAASLKEITAAVEVGVIQSLLEQGYSKSEAAHILGISRSSLWNKLPE